MASSVSFARTPDWVLDRGLSDGALALYTHMAHAADHKTRKLYHGHESLACLTRKSVSTVKRNLRELRRHQVLTITERSDGDKQLPNLYHLPVADPRLAPGQICPGVKSADDPGSRMTHDLEQDLLSREQAAAPEQSGSDGELPLVVEEDQDLAAMTEACLLAAVFTVKAQAAVTGKRIGNVRSYARPRAVEYLDRYRADLTHLLDLGKTIDEMADWVATTEDRQPPQHLASVTPPRLQEFHRQSDFSDTQEWQDQQPVDLGERRRQIADEHVEAAASGLTEARALLRRQAAGEA